MGVKLKHASGNGTVIGAPAANPSADITLKAPSTTGSAGQVLKVASANHSSTNAELEWADDTDSGAGSYNATAVSVGTAATYTFAAGISADAKIVYLTWDDISPSASSWVRLRVGTSSAFVSSGYLGQHGYASGSSGSMQGVQYTDEIPLLHQNFDGAANAYSGMLTLIKHTGNKWIYQGITAVDGQNYPGLFYGSVDVGGALNRFEFALEQNSAVFDGGTVNCRWVT